MMLRLGLPRLFGLPWETWPDGRGEVGLLPAGLMPFIVTGSPITKTVGQLVAVQWGVRNSGGQQRVAEIYLTNRSTGAARFLWSGPMSINALTDVPMSLLWNTAGVPVGVYSITIGLDEVTSTGAFVQGIGADDFTLNLGSANPIPLFTVGQRVHLIGTSFVGMVKSVDMFQQDPSRPPGYWIYSVSFTDPRIDPVVQLLEFLLEPDPGIPIVAPTLTVLSPAQGSTFSLGTSATFTGQARNYKGEDVSSQIAWLVIGFNPATDEFFLVASATGSSVTVTLSVGGNLAVRARVTDVNSGLASPLVDRSINVV